METRVQRINGDTLVELSETVVTKIRHSEKALLRRKAYFEALIAKGEQGLLDVSVRLAIIRDEREKSI